MDMDFIDYLAEKHMDKYTGDDDGAADAFEQWLGDLMVDEWLEYGDKFAKRMVTRAKGVQSEQS